LYFGFDADTIQHSNVASRGGKLRLNQPFQVLRVLATPGLFVGYPLAPRPRFRAVPTSRPSPPESATELD
jgi:hypothetical protein